MSRVFACISLLAVAAGVGCAARQPIVVAPPPAAPEAELERRERIVVAPFSLTDAELPKFGEYVYVEVLPEAIWKVTPQYPDVARESRVEGTVMVQALVGKDGTVKDTRIVKSIPMLDAAATAAVRLWLFKPAQVHGEPVAVWVAVPVKFTLH